MKHWPHWPRVIRPCLERLQQRNMLAGVAWLIEAGLLKDETGEPPAANERKG